MTNISLSVLNGRNGFIIQGVAEDGLLGDAVSNAGDINGDGIVDILVGANGLSVSGDSTNEGQVSIVFGSDTGFEGRITTSDLDGSNGFSINGISPQQRFGFAVSNAGDINNDEIDDLVIGANGTNNNQGDSYIIFGNAAIGDAAIDLGSLDNGFKIDGIAEGDRFGGAVTDLGDLNGDGIDDIAISANSVTGSSNESATAIYVIFGQETGFSESIDLSTLDGITNGLILNGFEFGDGSEISLSSAGDLNGDETNDLLIGLGGAAEAAGTTYVVFGQAEGFDANLNLSTLDGSNGFTIDGITAGDTSGSSVSLVGDVNGDGIDDIGIGAPSASDNVGQGYIVFGTDGGFAESFSLSDLDGSNGFAINGIAEGDRLGTSVSAAGDMNGDSIGDFVISAVGAGAEAGASYVIFGREAEAEFAPTLNLSDLNINQGFAIEGIVAGDRSGQSVSNLGDVNSDGLDDLLVGAPLASTEEVSNVGEAYVVFGRVENLGDADGDGAYTNADAYLISQMAVGLISEFEAYSGIDPLLVADVNSDGVISALDSAIVYSNANDSGTSGIVLT